MTRKLTSHKVNDLNDLIDILVLDAPGSGGACHHYLLVPKSDPNLLSTLHERTLIKFQNGPIAEAGVNGISIESLLAIVEDRLQGFQSGPFATRENAVALTKIQEAMMWLHKRTRDRIARGVEGTSQA